jgi:hypothetical protein
MDHQNDTQISKGASKNASAYLIRPFINSIPLMASLFYQYFVAEKCILLSLVLVFRNAILCGRA